MKRERIPPPVAIPGDRAIFSGMSDKTNKPTADAKLKAKALGRWENEGGAPASGAQSTTKPLKRPRDPIALAKLIGDIATGQVDDKTTKSVPKLRRRVSSQKPAKGSLKARKR